MKIHRKIVLFTLSMPGRNSWNGRWSGEGKKYNIVRKMTAKEADETIHL